MRVFWTTVAVLALSLAGCQCGPDEPQPDGGERPDAGPPARPDGGVIVLPPDASFVWPEQFAAEPCPPEAFGVQVEPDGGLIEPPPVEDGGFTFGLCIALRTLSGEALLNGQPETRPIELHFLAGGFESEVARVPDSLGLFQVKVMRGRYDILEHQPGGVWPYFEGRMDHGPVDMTKDQQRSLRATSHTLRGGVRYGSLPFRPSPFPPDVTFEAFGLPTWQRSGVTSQSGVYELKLLEGVFGLFLSTPPTSLFGTELRNYLLTPTRNINLDRDREFDVEIPTSLLEGTITFDGEAIPDMRQGTDFTIAYTRPGDSEATIFSHHEGGLPSFAALVPKGQYGTTFDFRGVPNPTFPARIVGKELWRSVDLREDSTLDVDFPTFAIEGGITIDGRPPRSNPNYNMQLYLIGLAGNAQGNSFLLYEIPLESGAFRVRAFPGNYFVILNLDEGLAEGLATGWLIIDRYYQLQNNRSMPIALETSQLTGRLTIDGKAPVTGRQVGTFSFRDRTTTVAQYSWYTKSIEVSEDGTYSVRLPKGDYEMYFTIDRTAYPEYASGRTLMVSRIPLWDDQTVDINYETVSISGPLRVGGEVVRDTIGGPEVGMRMQRETGVNYEWRFEGGSPNYVVRVPRGTYKTDFLIFENAFDGVAFGNAPLGFKFNLMRMGMPLQDYSR